MGVCAWAMSLKLFCEAGRVSEPTGWLLGRCRLSPGIRGGHAELAHVHGDRIEVRISGAKLLDDWELPAEGSRRVLVEKVSPTPHLDIVELKYEFDMLCGFAISFVPVFGTHVFRVQVL